MTFTEVLGNLLRGGKAKKITEWNCEAIDEIVGDIVIRELAFWQAVNMIANAIGKCEFKTYASGNEAKGHEYYLWNVEPNRNQNSSAFIHKWISALYHNNECLIVEQKGIDDPPGTAPQLLVADSFVRNPSTIYGDYFTQVTVDDLLFRKTFRQSEVLYFKLSEKSIRLLLNSLFSSYSKLIAYSMKAFQRSRGTKGKFKYDTLPTAGTEQRRLFDELVNERIGKWLSSDNAALPLGRGQDFEELTSKTYSSESTRDIRAQVDDVVDFTARAFGIPPALLTGNVAGLDSAVEQFLTFCIDPLAAMLEEEINRKRNGFSGFAAGTQLHIDTKSIKHIDLLSVSTSIDKLISSGAFCINDIQELVGNPPIDEEWASQHFMTKNYATITEALTALGGGENNA